MPPDFTDLKQRPMQEVGPEVRSSARVGPGLLGIAWIGSWLQLIACSPALMPPPDAGVGPVREGLDPQQLPAPSSALSVLTVEEVLDQVDAWKAEVGDPSVSLCAAFDADGTLWRGDFGMELSARAIASGLVRAEALDPLQVGLARFGLASANTPGEAFERLARAWEDGTLHARGRDLGLSPTEVDRILWPGMNWLFTGWAPNDLEQFARTHWQEAFHTRVFAEAPRLLEGLRARGIRTVLVSAGLDPAVCFAGGMLGFSPEDARGQRSRILDGRWTASIEPPVLYDDGKVSVLESLCGAHPLLAFGDSAAGSDRGMLERAALPFVVSPSLRHKEFARARGWPVLSLERRDGNHGGI